MRIVYADTLLGVHNFFRHMPEIAVKEEVFGGDVFNFMDPYQARLPLTHNYIDGSIYGPMCMNMFAHKYFEYVLKQRPQRIKLMLFGENPQWLAYVDDDLISQFYRHGKVLVPERYKMPERDLQEIRNFTHKEITFI